MPAPPLSPTLPLLQRRTMRVLVIAQLLGALGLAAGGTSGALLAEHLTGNPAAAGLPLSLLVLGSGWARWRSPASCATMGGAPGSPPPTWPVPRAPRWWWPRRRGKLAAAAGRQPPAGGGNAAVMLARYAAADLASRRGRAISTVVAAASVGAIAGPNLLGPAGVLAGRSGSGPGRAVPGGGPGVPGGGAGAGGVPAARPAAGGEEPGAVGRGARRGGGRGELAALLGDGHSAWRCWCSPSPTSPWSG